MPLYEYECEACGLRFEVIRRFSDPPLEQCTACSGKVRKLLSSPAIQFKGSGWYVTDYAKKGEAPASTSTGAGTNPGTGTNPESGTSTESSAKTDSSPSSKPKE